MERSAPLYLRRITPLRLVGVGLLVGAAILYFSGAIEEPREWQAEQFFAFPVVLVLCFWPMLISLGALGMQGGGRGSRGALLVSVLFYLGWFFYLFLTVFRGSSDAQAGIALAMAGFLSLPTMIPLWGLAWWLRRRWGKDGFINGDQGVKRRI